MTPSDACRSRLTGGATLYSRNVARICPFCPRPARSNEHVIPQWMSRGYMADAGERAFFTRSEDGLPQRTAKLMDDKVKVCTACNNGWMSRLEEAAGPVLEQLAYGDIAELSEVHQEVISRWLFKTAAMQERLLPAARWVSTAEQRQLLSQGRIPAGWSAHVAHADLSEHAIRHHLGPTIQWLDDDGSVRGKVRLTTMQFGALATQVVFHTLDVNPAIRDVLGGDRFAAQIWPTLRTVAWPPGATIIGEWFEIVCDLRNQTEPG